MALFGKKQPEGKTFLLLDIENGSVGGGLVYATEGTPPRLFGEMRTYTQVAPTRDSTTLLNDIAALSQSVATHTAAVAARLRHHPKGGALGHIERTLVFCSAPWGTPNFASGPQFVDAARERVLSAVHSTFPHMPATFYTTAGATLGALRRVLPYEESYLVCLISGEVSELILVSGGRVAGYATVPFGRHTVVRTLRTHAGYSQAEAYSALRLPGTHNEVLALASAHFADELAEVVADLMKGTLVSRVYVVAHGNTGEWFAKSLARSAQLGGIFPSGSTVRALHPRHVMPHLAGREAEPDLMVGLQALFTDGYRE